MQRGRDDKMHEKKKKGEESKEIDSKSQQKEAQIGIYNQKEAFPFAK
jgi:hypothetical protein